MVLSRFAAPVEVCKRFRGAYRLQGTSSRLCDYVDRVSRSQSNSEYHGPSGIR